MCLLCLQKQSMLSKITVTSKLLVDKPKRNRLPLICFFLLLQYFSKTKHISIPFYLKQKRPQLYLQLLLLVQLSHLIIHPQQPVVHLSLLGDHQNRPTSNVHLMEEDLKVVEVE